MLVTTEAIMLRSRKQGDTSKIVSLYTRDYGLVDVIAKGAREMKSKFGSALEPFNCAKVTFYKKEGRDLYLLSGAETALALRNLQSDLEHIEAATKVVELLLRSQNHEECHPELYALVKQTLQIMSDCKDAESVLPILFAYYLQYIHFAGFAMRLSGENIEPNTQYYFDIESGEVISRRGEALPRPPAGQAMPDPYEMHSEKMHKLSPETLAALRHIERSGITNTGSLRLSPNARHALETLFRSYFNMHIEGMQHSRSKSGKVFSAMGNPKN
jgi:DNA repair protein RecO (recombination protein O)